MTTINLINKKDLFNDDNYINVFTNGGFVEQWDFSRANTSHEARVEAVSKVASVCYGNEGLKPNFKLYDKLSRESIGLPSSSFEFVPILLNMKFQYSLIFESWEIGKISDIPNVARYGQFIKDDNYVITNLRALMYDLQKIKESGIDDMAEIDDDYWFNNDEKEIEIIKNNFKVFRIKATIRDFRQHERHRRAMYQELSRRYTTGNKVPLEFRFNSELGQQAIQHAMLCTKIYHELLMQGIKAEDARDILPVSLCSTVWTAYYPDGLDNYLNLRTKSSAQKEIRAISEAMKELIGD